MAITVALSTHASRHAPGGADPVILQAPAQTFTKSGTLAVTTDAVANKWYNDSNVTVNIAKVRISVITAPTGLPLIVDCNIDGTTAFTTQANRPTVAVSTTTILSVAPNVTAVAPGHYVTINIDQVGSVVAGAEMTATVVFA